MSYFTEYDTGNGHNRVLGACAPQGVKQPYQVLYEGSPGPYPAGKGYMAMTSTGLTSYMFADPWQLGWSFQPDYLGEVTDTANDMPGSKYATADFTALGIQAVDTGLLRSVPCYLKRIMHDNYGYYANTSGCDHTWIWTDPF